MCSLHIAYGLAFFRLAPCRPMAACWGVRPDDVALALRAFQHPLFAVAYLLTLGSRTGGSLSRASTREGHFLFTTAGHWLPKSALCRQGNEHQEDGRVQLHLQKRRKLFSVPC